MTISAAAIIGIYLLINIYSTAITAQILENTWRFIVISGIVLVFGIITTPILAHAEAKKDAAPAPSTPPVDEAAMRTQIESEVRAKVEAEMREKAAAEAAQTQTPTEPQTPTE